MSLKETFSASKKLSTAVLWLLVSLVLLSTQQASFASANWHSFTMRELSNYVSEKATKNELTSLARKKLSFQITDHHCTGVQDYIDLIRALASKIPTEYERPVISLKIFLGPSKNIQLSKSLGILGGMGPLSDASLLKLVFAEIASLSRSRSDQTSIIHLLSMPPPRETWDQFTGGLTYASRLHQFAKKGYGAYVLASNTAHLHYDGFRMLVEDGSVINLPEAVAAHVVSQTLDTEPVLILGSQLAWENQLYDKIFIKRKKHHIRLRSDDQIQLQKWIDQTKQGTMTANDEKLFFDFIAKISEKYGAKTILLACTEIPLGLGRHLNDLETSGFRVFDSEEIFAKTIARYLLSKMSL